MTEDPRPLSATLEVAASPAAVWAVVARVRDTPRWSPECRRVVPVPRRVRRGGLLLGFNRRGRVRWATVSRVSAFDPGRRIAWVVLTNRSEWSYTLEPAGTGTAITQTRRTPRGESRFALWFTRRLLGGQAGHDDELEAGMRDGLRTIGALAAARDPASVT